MVEETVSKEQEYRQFEDPLEELDRAVSDYLHISRTYKNYFTASAYQEAEEKAWQRLQNALEDPKLEI